MVVIGGSKSRLYSLLLFRWVDDLVAILLVGLLIVLLVVVIFDNVVGLIGSIVVLVLSDNWRRTSRRSRRSFIGIVEQSRAL